MNRRTLLKRLAAAAVLPSVYAGYARASGLRGSSEWLYQALRGNVPGVTRVVIAGTNLDVDTASVPEDLWGGTGLIPRPAAAESWEVLSSSVNDTAAGTGARTVFFETLSAAGAIQTQTVTLNGVTPVALPNTHIAVNMAAVASNGTSGHNEGTITVRVAGAGADRGYISTPNGILNQARYTVPTGYRLDLLSMLVGMRSTLGNESTLVTFMSRTPAGRELMTVPFPLFAAGTSIYRHETAGGLTPFVSLSAGNEATVRALSVTQNNMVLDTAILGLRFDTTNYPHY